MGWYLLCIAILSQYPVGVEGAQILFDKGTLKGQSVAGLSEELCNMKESGMSYKEIGIAVGMNKQAVCKRVMRYRKKEGNGDANTIICS